MRYEKAMDLAENLVERFRPACERLEIAGSLRRERNQVGDIEIVAIPRFDGVGQAGLFGDGERSSALHALVTSFVPSRILPIKPGVTRGEIILDPKWSRKSTASSRYWRLWLPHSKIAVDLFMATAETWGSIFTIRTGSADFAHALVQVPGITFEKGRLHRDGKLLDTPKERDVFEACGISWVEPCDRHGRRQITALRRS